MILPTGNIDSGTIDFSAVDDQEYDIIIKMDGLLPQSCQPINRSSLDTFSDSEDCLWEEILRSDLKGKGA